MLSKVKMNTKSIIGPQRTPRTSKEYYLKLPIRDSLHTFHGWRSAPRHQRGPRAARCEPTGPVNWQMRHRSTHTTEQLIQVTYNLTNVCARYRKLNQLHIDI